MLESYTRWIIKWRYLVIISCFSAIILAASGIHWIEINNDYEVFFSKDNPQLLAFQALKNTYSANDNLLFMIMPENGKVFTPRVLDLVEKLTQKAWTVPYTSRVDSVTNFQYTYAQGDDLIVENLVENARQKSLEDLQRIKQIAVNEPFLQHKLVDKKGSVTAVNLNLELRNASKDAMHEIVTTGRKLAAYYQQQYPGIHIYLSGMAALNNAFPDAIKVDIVTLIPAMYILILLVLWFLLRSVTATLVILLVIAGAVLASIGLVGWMGMEFTSPLSSAPTIIMTLAVADCVHLFITLLHEMYAGKEKHVALIESLRINMQPIFLTSVTTAIGFMSLNFSDAPPFRDLGNISALGVGLAFFLSITLLPALISILPVNSKGKKGDTEGSKHMLMLANFVISRPKKLFYSMILLIVSLIIFIPRIELNDEFIRYFDESIEFRRHTDMIAEKLSGIYAVEFALDSGVQNGINQPQYLHTVDNFVQWIREQAEVDHVNSFTDTLKRLNKNMHGDDPIWYKLPEKQDLAAQYLFLYELSLPYGMDLNNQINITRSGMRISVTLKNLDNIRIRDFTARAEKWLQDNAPKSMHTHGVSTTVMFAHIAERNIRSMLLGTFIALILISLLLIISLRSVKIGLLSLIPNLVPVMMAFGLWGLLVGQVGLASSVVAAMTLGIVVDDTVHFLSKYLRARREQQLTVVDAIRYAFSHVGRALWVTTAVLVSGFLVLSQSAFALNSSMGALTGITLLLALMTDFLFLPILLMKVDKNPIGEQI